MNSKHSGNLTTSKVSRVEVDATGAAFNVVDVISVKGTTLIYFTIACGDTNNGQAVVEPPDPTVAGDNTYVLTATLAGPGAMQRIRVPGGTKCVVKAITSGASEQIAVVCRSRGEVADSF